MPSPPLANTLDGITDGTPITTGNSGSTSGDAASSITGTLTARTTNALRGSSMEIASGATFASQRWHWSTLGNITGDLWFRTYFRMEANPSAELWILSMRDSAGAAASQFSIQTNGTLEANTGAAVAGTSTTALATGQWVRIEIRFNAGAGEIEWWIYNTPESTTADDHAAYTGLTLGNGTINEMRLGHATSPGPINFTTLFDEFALSTTAKLGPTGGGGGGPADPALNTNFSVTIGDEFALRTDIQETGGGTGEATGFHLYAQKNVTGGYQRVTTTSSGLRIVPTARFVDGAATTDLLSGGTGTFVAGEGDEGGATGTITIAAGGNTEIEWALAIDSAGTVAGDFWDVRVYRSNGTPLDAYTSTPRITAAAAAASPTIGLNPTSLSFSVPEGSGVQTKNLSLSNTGGGTLAFTVSDDQTWLSVSPASGNAPQTLVVSVDGTTLTQAGSPYTGTITVAATGATNTPQTVTVTVTVGPPASFPVFVGSNSGDNLSVWEETSNDVAPIVAPNGAMYVCNENGMFPPTYDRERSPPGMRKSTDGGATWTQMDTQLSGKEDIESATMMLVGTDIVFAFQRSGYYGYFNVFDTTTDTWTNRTEAWRPETSITGTDQVCTLARRSDGTYVLVGSASATSAAQLFYKIRDTTPVWGSETVIDSEAGKDFSQAFIKRSVVNDTVHIIYQCVTDGILYYRSLSAAGVLSARTQIATGLWNTGNLLADHRKAMPNQGFQLWSDGGADRGFVAYRKNDGKIYGRQLDWGTTPPSTPTVGSEEAISGTFAHQSPSGIASFQTVGCLIVDSATQEVHYLYSRASQADGRAGDFQMRWRSRSAAGTWGTETSPHNSEPVAAMAASVITYSGQKYLMVFYDEFTGIDPGISKFTRFEINEATTPKSASDAQSAVSEVSSQAAVSSASDSQTSVSESPTTASALTASDARTSVIETSAAAAAQTATDARVSVTETATPTATPTASDAQSSVVEAATGAVLITASDSGSATEVASVQAQSLLTGSDSGVDVEASVTTVMIAASDSGSATEVSSSSGADQKATLDRGSGIEGDAVLDIDDGVSEGTGLDASTLDAQATATDSGGSIESASLGGSDQKTSLDRGAGSEGEVIIDVDDNLPDGTGQDASTLSTSTLASDTGSVTESTTLSSAGAVTTNDSASVAESAIKSAVSNTFESGSGADASTGASGLLGSDTASSTEAVSGQASVITASEVAGASEASSLGAQTNISSSDAGAAQESAASITSSSRTDSGSTLEAASLLQTQAFTGSDSGSSSDTSAPLVTASTRTEAGAATEAAGELHQSARTDASTSALDTSRLELARSDQGAGTDALSVFARLLQELPTISEGATQFVTLVRAETGLSAESALLAMGRVRAGKVRVGFVPSRGSGHAVVTPDAERIQA